MRTALMLLCLALGAPAARAESIVTGGSTGTYYKVGQDLKQQVAPSLEVEMSEGSRQNVIDLSEKKGVSLAIVQSDVYSSFVRLRDQKSNPPDVREHYATLLRNLRVFMPLYNEEIHFIVRKDSGMDDIEDIKGKKIWMDSSQSGTYLTVENIYFKLFGTKPDAVEPFTNNSATGDDPGTKRRRSALMALSDPKFYSAFPQVDVMVLVGGQPYGLLQDALPSNLKLLKYDAQRTDPHHLLLEDYVEADIARSNYPLLNMDGDVRSLAVTSYLVTAVFADAQRNEFIHQFAHDFCAKFPELQEHGHPKWKALAWHRGVPLPKLTSGWRYSEIARRELDHCGAPAAELPVKPTPAKASASGACSDLDLSLHICTR